MRAANNFKYEYGPSAPGGGIGATDEYFANTYQIPSYTLEIEPSQSGTEYGGFGVSHDGFILPDSEVNRMRTETSNAALAGLYSIAELPVLQELQILNDNDELVRHQVWQVSSGNRTLEPVVAGELLAGQSYKLRLVFNKPMRQLSGDTVVAFSTLSQPLGISLNWQINTGDSSTDVDIAEAEGQWLTQGFKRYKTDTFEVTVSLPDDFVWADTSLLALNVDTTDMTGQKLDANPATISDWQQGTLVKLRRQCW